MKTISITTQRRHQKRNIRGIEICDTRVLFEANNIFFKKKYLIEMTSSTSLQKAMQSCPRPMVYFPLLAPSWASSASCIQGTIYETAGSKHDAQFLLNMQLPGSSPVLLKFYIPSPFSAWIFREQTIQVVRSCTDAKQSQQPHL